MVNFLLFVSSLTKEPGEGAAIFHDLFKIFIFSLFSISGPFIINFSRAMAPDCGRVLDKLHVFCLLSRAYVPESAFTGNTSVLEVESLVAGHASIELGLEPDGSDRLVFITLTFMVTALGVDCEEVGALRDLLEVFVPFHPVNCINKVLVIRKSALVVKLVWDMDILSVDSSAVGVLCADDADTCGEGVPGSLDHLLLHGLDSCPIRTIWRLVEGLQAVLQDVVFVQEVPRIGRMHAN